MTGKTIRMKRIFRDDEKAVVVAMDHGQFQGPIPGITDMPQGIANVVKGRPDAVIVNPGILSKHCDLIPRDTGVILRITGASTNYSPEFDFHRLTTTVEYALQLGADAVIVMCFVGGKGESPSLQIVGTVAEQCDKNGVPLVVEVLPQNMDHFLDPKYIASGVRAAYELGADVVKVYYTGKDTFKQITRTVPIPVLIAGGPKDQESFQMVSEAMQLGAKGVAFGRNVFQASDPTKYVEKLVRMVHNG